jgi:hypothetical protein
MLTTRRLSVGAVVALGVAIAVFVFVSRPSDGGMQGRITYAPTPPLTAGGYGELTPVLDATTTTFARRHLTTRPTVTSTSETGRASSTTESTATPRPTTTTTSPRPTRPPCTAPVALLCAVLD